MILKTAGVTFVITALGTYYFSSKKLSAKDQVITNKDNQILELSKKYEELIGHLNLLSTELQSLKNKSKDTKAEEKKGENLTKRLDIASKKVNKALSLGQEICDKAADTFGPKQRQQLVDTVKEIGILAQKANLALNNASKTKNKKNVAECEAIIEQINTKIKAAQQIKDMDISGLAEFLS